MCSIVVLESMAKAWLVFEFAGGQAYADQSEMWWCADKQLLDAFVTER
jgi:hypothetical protein